MKKIVIIGNGGKGKSTPGDKISRLTGINIYHSDKLTFMPGWKRVKGEDFKSKLTMIIQ